jgi:hypothetical protein
MRSSDLPRMTGNGLEYLPSIQDKTPANSVLESKRQQSSHTSSKPPPLKAVQHIRRMPGGSQSHLLKCSDGLTYVVKCQNNPQGRRILINELVCGFLAAQLNLPAPRTTVVQVDEEFLSQSKEMYMELPDGRIRWNAGPCFGSECQLHLRNEFDFWPEARINQIINLRDHAGILVFDIWTSNRDFRQERFFDMTADTPFRFVMVDNGDCFRGEEWAFKDKARPAMCPMRYVYRWISGIDSFEPWLSNLECQISRCAILQTIDRIPSEWFRRDRLLFKEVLLELDRRRSKVRAKLLLLRQTAPNCFPLWLPPESLARATAAWDSTIHVSSA